MKSEWMSKKLDVKKKLERLFGEYSAFKPSQQQATSNNNNETVTEATPSAELNNIVEGTHNQEQASSHNQQEQHQKSTSRSNVESLIEEFVDVPRPLSPVNSIHDILKKENDSPEGAQLRQTTTDANASRKDQTKAVIDVIMEQFSRISPLLSPINLDISDGNDPESEHNPIPMANEVQITPKRTSDGELRRKRPRSGSRDHPIVPVKLRRRKEDGKNEESQMRYTINLKDNDFDKLLAKIQLNRIRQKDSSEKSYEPTINPLQQQIKNEPKSNFLDDGGDSTSSMINFKVPEKKSPSDFFTAHARELKKRAEQERHRLRQVLLFFESIAYSIMAASILNGNKPERLSPQLNEITNLLNSSWNAYKRQKTADGESSIKNRLKIIQMKVSSCLAFQLYSIRSPQALNNYTMLNQYEKENPKTRPASRTNGSANEGGSANGATPSPASSSGSHNSQSTVALPVDIYQNMSQQIRILHHLMWSFRIWKEAKKCTPEVQEFIDGLNKLCGKLHQDSSLEHLALFLLNAIHFLRQKYEALESSGW